MPRTSHFDVWHTTNQVSRYRPFNKQTKVILTIHDLNFLIEKSGHPDKIRKYLAIVKEKIERADVIVCISHYTLNQVKEYFNLEGKEQHVIYNGCTFPATENTTAPHYQPQKPFLFSIGTILPKKNFHVLPALLSKNDFELIIAGNVSSKEYLIAIQKEAQKHGVQDRVKVIGPVSENDKYWYYNHCEAFLFPSLAEGFGLPVIEAMHFGKPVFLSDKTSLPEIGGDMAFYFENFEADDMRQQLEKGLTNYAMNSFSEKIKSHSLQFSWDNTAKEYLKLYQKLSNY